MKFTSLATIALATLAAAPALAVTSDGAKSPNADEAKLTAAMDQLNDLVHLGKPIQATLEDIEQLVRSQPGPSSMRVRMQAYLEDLAERARSTYVSQYDIAVFRGDFAESRIIAFLGELDRRAKGGGLSDEQFGQVLEGWISRGRAFADAPDPEQYRARFQAVAQNAIRSARNVTEFAERIQAEWDADRLPTAARTLAKRKADGSASPMDYDRVASRVIRVRRLRNLAGASL